MKRIILALILGVSLATFGQSIKSLSIDQLEIKKEEAIKNENFVLAQEIKKEIESRKSTKELKSTTEHQLKLAVASEDFEKAALLKDKLSTIDEIEELEEGINVAVANEDFVLAEQLKLEKGKKINSLIGNEVITKNKIINKDQKDSSTKDLQSEVKVVFEGLKPYDIFINEEYIGSINKKYNLEVILNSGDYDLRFVALFTANPNSKMAQKRLTIKGNETFTSGNDYLVSLGRYINSNSAIKNGLNKYVVSSSTTPNVTKKVVEQSFDSPIFIPRTTTYAATTYSRIKTVPSAYGLDLPENGSGFTMNLTDDFTTPISSDNGLVAGGSFSTSMTTTRIRYNAISSSESSYLSFGLYAILGYQVELDFITFQPNISYGPSYYSSYPTGGVDESGISFGGALNLGSMVFFDPSHKFGFLMEGNFGFQGGSSFSMGLVFGKISHPQHRHLVAK